MYKGPSINDTTNLEERGNLPKGDITPLVKWVRRGQKSQNMGVTSFMDGPNNPPNQTVYNLHFHGKN